MRRSISFRLVSYLLHLSDLLIRSGTNVLALDYAKILNHVQIQVVIAVILIFVPPQSEEDLDAVLTPEKGLTLSCLRVKDGDGGAPLLQPHDVDKLDETLGKLDDGEEPIAPRLFVGDKNNAKLFVAAQLDGTNLIGILPLERGQSEGDDSSRQGDGKV